MFDFVPLKNYYDLYLNISLLIVVVTLFHTFVLKIDDKKNIAYTNFIGYCFLIFSVLYIGYRPLSGRYFGDMTTYNTHFLRYTLGGEIDSTQDAFFHYFMKFCSYFLDSKNFFMVCVILYILPIYRVSKVFFKEYWFYAFLMFVTSFSFWSYGTNGIRNGIATSFFLLAISFYNKKVWMIIFFIISTQVHQTLLLPTAAFVLVHFYSKSKHYLLFWFIAIPLSIALGGFWENLFASLGFGDERLSGYLVGEGVEGTTFSSTGFRYDFLVYSAAAVFTGWYFIFKKKFEDKIYIYLYNTYLICNAFWILVIRANFSNRFAYLSWFFMGLIIIYPFLKKDFFSNHHQLVGKVLTAYFMFTYFMVFIYYRN